MIFFYASTGIDEDDRTGKCDGNFALYVQHFEAPFVEATRAFYLAEARQHLDTSSVVELVRRVDERIEAETNRVEVIPLAIFFF